MQSDKSWLLPGPVDSVGQANHRKKTQAEEDAGHVDLESVKNACFGKSVDRSMWLFMVVFHVLHEWLGIAETSLKHDLLP